ncbi:hypothetical protein O181_005744 [Austropuccinia psidii MF-1]|uniref:Uncharacterized protein n=1 Tax=Austropuccinia psidii MF-1 TaxID=1389203 RepID=A0A9Q3GG64_9BASI|nr:hypothetical protein [Austropuccinia psidii MF-1]
MLGNVGTNPLRIDELLENSQNVPQRGRNSEILQGIELTIIKISNQKYKVLEQQKEGGKKGRSPRSFFQKATSSPTSPRGENNKKKNQRKPYTPS